MKKEKDYIALISEVSDTPYDSVLEQLRELKDTVGITPKDFYKNRLYTKTKMQQFITGSRIVRKALEKEELYHAIYVDSGLSKTEVDDRIKKINKENSLKISVEVFEKFELYKCDEAELGDRIQLLKRRKELKKIIRKKYREIDNGAANYDDVKTETEELFSIIEQLVSEHFARELERELLIYKPELVKQPEQLHKAIIDMEFTKFLLNFHYSEYVSFDFVGKTIEEKREFINDLERVKLLRKVNDEKKFEVLDDKYEAYKLLKKHYGRKMLIVRSQKDYRKFLLFCLRRKNIVVKPFYESLGRGVKAIDVSDNKRIKEIFKELCHEYNIFVVEDLIIPHEAIKRLNPDSVNTVRMITYYDGVKTIIHHPFMRAGRKGSFIDNGGAGGIFVAVDAETGILSSDGCDERGITFEYHPDTNIKFKGYKIPNWDQAIELANQISTKIPGIRYIGWDFALNNKGKWIVVEGNARTQFLGQQCTTKIGLRKEVFSTLKQPFF